MKKSDLKDGMIVECRNGMMYLVLPDIFVNIDGYNDPADYTEGLCVNYSDDDFDIIKVYEINSVSCFNIHDIFDKNNLNLIWERPKEMIELTLEDIAEKYNVDVTQIKIKK